MRVTMIHAMHSCGICDDGKIIYGGEAAGYVLALSRRPRRSISPAIPTSFPTCSSSSSSIIRSWPFCPSAIIFTMSPREAALACRLLYAKRVIPMHFGTFPQLTGHPEQLAELLKDFPETEVWPLEIGKPVKW